MTNLIISDIRDGVLIGTFIPNGDEVEHVIYFQTYFPSYSLPCNKTIYDLLMAGF
jgi:hypothetical protein